MSSKKTSGGWYSGETQVAWACRALTQGRSISHKSEIRAVNGWRPGAIVHRLKWECSWPIKAEHRGPENIACYSLPNETDWASLRYPKSARAVAEEWGAAA